MLQKGSICFNVHRLFAIGVLCFVFLFCSFQATHAQVDDANLQAISQTTGLGGSDLPTIIGNIINIFFGLLGIILLGYLLYAGFLWMTSGGDEKKVAEAKTMIRNAVIGLVIIVSAFALARFILSALTGADDGAGIGGGSGAGGGGGVGFPGSAGSLGAGIIEYHIPERDARGIPRNMAIAITFKEPIKIASFIQDYNDNGTPANLTDDPASSTTIGLNAAAVRIYPTGTPDKNIKTAEARVRFTGDRKTFVIKPVGLLGSPTQNTGYTVELIGGRNGIVREDGKAAFGGAFASGYKWSFEVSTVVDNTPPRITAVIPSAGGRYAPNIVVQLNFNEAIDPTSASGLFSNGKGFTNVQVGATPIAQPNALPSRPNGEFKISNHYTTVEFVTDVPCGVNSCGKQIFCLPSDSAITVLAKAATLSKSPPEAELTQSGYDGVTDMVGNSLDGNGNGKAEGSSADDYGWGFGTESKPNLDAPRVRSSKPAAGDKNQSSNIPLDQSPQADFDSVLQASTVVSDHALIRTNENQKFADTFWWTPLHILLNKDGMPVSSSEPIVSGRLSIKHRVYMPSTDKKAPPFEYYPTLLSGIQNVYQNCFVPAGSNVCRGPNCCDDKASNNACPYPVKP